MYHAIGGAAFEIMNKVSQNACSYILKCAVGPRYTFINGLSQGFYLVFIAPLLIVCLICIIRIVIPGHTKGIKDILSLSGQHLIAITGPNLSHF